MKFSGRIYCEQLGKTDDPELQVCKIGSVKTKQAEPLSLKEKATFALDLQNKKLATKVEDYNKRIKLCLE
jgi:hypothetical protein